MWLSFILVARAAEPIPEPKARTEPVLLPISADPVVGDRPARLGATGEVSSEGDLAGGGLAELQLASRVGVAVTVGAEDGQSLLGVGGRVAILGEEHGPLDLGAGLKYKAEGFDPGRSELEINVAAARHLGQTRLLAGVTVGRELLDNKGDAEASLAVLHPIGDWLSFGLDGRARAAMGTAEGDEEEEADLDAEGRPEWDAVAGALIGVGHGPLGAFLFGGAQALALRDVGVVGSGLVSVGVQVVP